MIGIAQSAVTILLFVVMLGTLVLVHEVGHFVAARLARVRVLEFGIGFPPRAKVLGRRGDTLYTLHWLPIGGFVKLEGEDGGDESDPRSFASQRLPVKLGILVAGVTMNLLLSFVIFTGIALTTEPALGVRIGTVDPSSPAATVGLAPGDVVVAVNGARYPALDGQASVQAMIDDLRANAGRTVTLGIQHADGTPDTVTVVLRVPASPEEGALGVAFAAGLPVGSLQYTPGEAVRIGAQRTVDAFGLILAGLADLGRSIVTDPTTAPPAAGPVGIAYELGDVLWGLGPLYVLYMAGLLSANLALVNALPFPPLDGGRMLVVTLKSFAGERISMRAERMTYAVGFVALFTFLIWITVFDIARQVGGGTP